VLTFLRIKTRPTFYRLVQFIIINVLTIIHVAMFATWLYKGLKNTPVNASVKFKYL